MHYVNLLQSETVRLQHYIGGTSDLKRRLADHNAGGSPHTSKYLPWKLVTYVAFSDKQKAEEFERYLKSGSGHAFARSRAIRQAPKYLNQGGTAQGPRPYGYNYLLDQFGAFEPVDVIKAGRQHRLHVEFVFSMMTVQGWR